MRLIPWKHLLGAGALFVLYFYGLSRTGLLGPDEPRYAAIGREMALSGDWITPRLWGEPWFEKPALLYWLVATGFRAGLGLELAPRVPVAVVSVAFLCFFYARVKREWGRRAGIFSALILATTAGWLAFSHVAVTDLPMSACFAASMLLCLAWIRSGGRRGLVLGGALLGLAVLGKGLVPVVLSLPLLWVGRRQWRDLAWFGAACTLVAAPWYLLCYARNGAPFLEEFFLRHHFERFATGEQLHAQPFWYYVPVLIGMLFPWSPLLATLRRRWIVQDRRLVFAALWLGFGFLFFSASSGKLPGYILPLLPAAALLIGVRTSELAAGGAWFGVSAVLLALIPVAGAVLPAAISGGLSRAPFPAMPLWPLWAALCFALLAIRAPAAVSLTLVAVPAIVGALWLKIAVFPELDRLASSRPLWIHARPHAHEVCLGELPRQYVYGLQYYATRGLPVCPDGAVGIFPSAEGPRLVPLL